MTLSAQTFGHYRHITQCEVLQAAKFLSIQAQDFIEDVGHHEETVVLRHS